MDTGTTSPRPRLRDAERRPPERSAGILVRMHPAERAALRQYARAHGTTPHALLLGYARDLAERAR